MPTYDYRCRDCDHEMEVQQSFSDEPLTVCPQCGGNLRKVFSAVGITFKGSGFYKTDSRGSSSSSSSSSSGSSSGSSSSSSSTGSGSGGSSGDSGSSSTSAGSTSTTSTGS